MDEEREQLRTSLRDTLKEGMVVKGFVTNIRDFGAFVDIGGIEGLLPISEISYGRVEDINEVLSMGQELEVAVKKIDWENNKFSFSLRDTQANPWNKVGSLYKVGGSYPGKVSRLAQFGAFVTLEDGVDGLLHISKLGEGQRIRHPQDVVSVGQQLQVIIEKIDLEERRIGLALKAGDEEQLDTSYAEQPAASGLGTLGDLLKASQRKKNLKVKSSKIPEWTLALSMEGSVQVAVKTCHSNNTPQTVQSMSESSAKSAILFSICMAHFLNPFMMSAVGVALPVMGREFDASALQLGLVETVFMLSMVTFLLAVGRFGDLYGRKRIFQYGLLTFACAGGLISLSGSIEMVIALRFFQGIGGAMVNATTMAILVAAFPPEQRGKALGIAIASVYAGISCGPFIGGFLIEYLGWRSIFFLMLPFGLTTWLVTRIKIEEEWADAKGESFDWRGLLVYAPSILLLVLLSPT